MLRCSAYFEASAQIAAFRGSGEPERTNCGPARTRGIRPLYWVLGWDLGLRVQETLLLSVTTTTTDEIELQAKIDGLIVTLQSAARSAGNAS